MGIKRNSLQTIKFESERCSAQTEGLWRFQILQIEEWDMAAGHINGNDYEKLKIILF